MTQFVHSIGQNDQDKILAHGSQGGRLLKKEEEELLGTKPVAL